MAKAVVVPGVYEAVDREQLAHMKARYQDLLKDNSARGKKWMKHYEDYEKLKKTLSTLSDEATRPAMIPLTSKAFMLGHLVHTNEIMVLLGDNWFAERSTKQAAAICQRRLDHCCEMLQSLTKERRLAQDWLREAEQLGKDTVEGEGNLEIREPYDEEKEARWRAEHKQRLREEKKKEKEGVKSSVVTDDDLWKRLDELELQEELEAHLESLGPDDEDSDDGGSEEEQNGDEAEHSDGEEGSDEPGAIESADASSDLSESPPLTDDEEDVEIQSCKMKRKVSFGTITTSDDIASIEKAATTPCDNEPICCIKFSHGTGNNTPEPARERSVAYSDPLEPPIEPVWALCPGDLSSTSGDTEAKSLPSGILKPFKPEEIRVWPEAKPRPTDTPSQKALLINPVEDVVKEREVVYGSKELAAPPLGGAKKMSKFKQARLASKK